MFEFFVEYTLKSFKIVEKTICLMEMRILIKMHSDDTLN